MRQFKPTVFIFIYALLSMATLSAQQGQYKLAYDVATQTYTVYGKVNTSYANPQSRFVNVFVTVMVPHGTGATKFLASNIQTNAALSSTNIVTMSRLDAPSYNGTKDYLFFNFDVGSANYTPNPITANTEFPIFSFNNSPNGCVGNINLIVHGDADYNIAQANSINASNAFSILGAGGDTYTSNYGTSPVVCSVVAPTITSSYSTPMTAGQTGTLTLTATNSAGNPAQSGMGYVYTLPPGLTIPAGATITNSCGGTATVTGNTVTFSGGTMASGSASCAISVPVLPASAGTIDPSTGAISSPVNVTPGPNNGAGISPTPIVVNPPSPPVITTAISPSPMTAGTPATLSITATNSAGNPAQSGLGYTYTVPTGLTIPAGSIPTNSCGGTATVSGNTVTFSGGTMAAGMATCVVSVPVVAAASGSIDLSTGVISSPVKVVAGPNNGAGPSPTPIVVNPPAQPVITTSISPSPMTAGTPSTLSITATNSAGNPAQSGLGYTYTVPTGLTIPAGSVPTNSCGGTATVSGNTVTFSGGTMAAGMASCVVTVPVIAASAGTVDPGTGVIANPIKVTPGGNNGAGVGASPIVVNPPACAANAGTLGY
jgi:hypothetical protein